MYARRLRRPALSLQLQALILQATYISTMTSRDPIRLQKARKGVRNCHQENAKGLRVTRHKFWMVNFEDHPAKLACMKEDAKGKEQVVHVRIYICIYIYAYIDNIIYK